MIAKNVLTFITDRGIVSGKAFTDFSIGGVIDTEQVGMDEGSQVLFQKCVGDKKCQASIVGETRLDIQREVCLNIKCRSENSM